MTSPQRQQQQQVWCLILDAACARIVTHLRGRGHRPIMLKGAIIAAWLYPDPAQRPYRDLDVLVAPHARRDVVAALEQIGYRSLIDESMLATSSPEEQPLAGPHGVGIDLHVALKGVRLNPQRAWEILDRNSEPCDWFGFEVRALAPPARAMHLALHVAQRGLVDVKAARDLELGLTVLERPLWHAAARLAQDLQAVEAFVAGLELLPAGRALLNELVLHAPISLETQLRAHSASTSAVFLERVFAAESWRQRLNIMRGRLFPSAAWLRLHRPESTRTPTGMLFTRIRRPVEVLAQLPLAAWERRSHRRRAHSGPNRRHRRSSG